MQQQGRKTTPGLKQNNTVYKAELEEDMKTHQ